MKLLFVLLATCIAFTAAYVAPLLNADAKHLVPDQYMVVFHRNSTSAIRDLHVAELKTRIAAHEKIIDTFSIGTLIGFSAVLSKKTLVEQLSHHNVRYVEADQVVTINEDSVTQANPTWGIDRVDQTVLPLSRTFTYWASAGAGVNAYVIDTGVYVDHDELRGRATFGATFITGEGNDDGNGHGTHVAGTIGGTTYGLAKKVSIIAVKVLSAGGSGSWAGVTSGINWVTNHYNTNGKKPSVANMSLGGGQTPTVDDAVEQSVAAGVIHAIAAGNYADNACYYSPARAPSAITVGATEAADNRASYSNIGNCLDIFAPGSSITSSWIGSTSATNTISGTSMASPHIAGVVALRLGHVTADQTGEDISPTGVDVWIKEVATKGVITDVGTGSPNNFVFSPYSEVAAL